MMTLWMILCFLFIGGELRRGNGGREDERERDRQRESKSLSHKIWTILVMTLWILFGILFRREDERERERVRVCHTKYGPF